MGKYFGTDGFRGEVNDNLTIDKVVKIGEFLGYYFKKNFNNSKFVIGRDTRLSGTMLESAIAAGINSTGGNVDLLGVTTTPSVAYLAKEESYACAIMISASHNPYYDNGIKLFNSKGEKMDEAVINLIEDYIDGKSIVEYAHKDDIGVTVNAPSLVTKYEKHLIDLGPKLTNIKIGLDLANGSATRSALNVFKALGVEPVIINSNPNGVNINTNCGSTHIEGLVELVKEKKLDCGFAYDGDADRCLAVDNNGNILSGDHILYMYGKYLKAKNELDNDTVVTTVMSNIGLYKAFDKENIKYAKTKVGDKYVYEYMKENNCVIGGEQSGHIIFIKNASTGDGILTSLKMLEVLVDSNKTFAELTEDLNIYPQVLLNVKVKSKQEVKNDKDINDLIDNITKELGDSGRILVRESGTEPLIRVMVEATTEDICFVYANKVVDLIKSKKYNL